MTKYMIGPDVALRLARDQARTSDEHQPLGDRVLQSVARKVADQLDWADTFQAECVALAQLQADAFITLEDRPALAVKNLVPVAPIDALYLAGTSF